MFDKFIQIIIDLEGGDLLHSHPNDPGGLTKFGISKKSFPQVDIENLTYESASRFYYHEFYLKYKLDKLYPSLSLCVLDAAINQGPGTAIRLLQRSVKAKEDGILGADTIKLCMDRANQDALVQDFLCNRILLYTKIGNFAIFGRGWIKRILKIHEASMVFRI
ncbi:MAG: putative Peptidoglycan domain protein [bacterium ADurb.Bin212]|nr:MAG: putative Peptidoglycan domain protein [bacterium ADurb.Bin212]